MLKIHQLFLRTYLIIFIATLLTLTSVTYFWAKNLYIHQIEKNLIQNLDILESFLENSKSIETITQITNTLSKKLGLRISIIDENGVVVAESHKNLSTLENHINRVEIIEASNIGLGKNTRVSETLGKDLLYIAKKVELNGKTYFIRMADYIDRIDDNFITLTVDIFVYISLFLFVAFLLTYFISTKIKKETDLVLHFLKDLSSKKEPIPLKSNYTFEFYKIAKLLNKVSIKLKKKEQLKAKHTAKLTLANRQKDDIISAISHEFKNPIAVISGYTQTLIDDKNMNDEMRYKFLNKIISNSTKMSNLIDKLRLSIRIQEKNQQLNLTNCSIKNLVENSISDLLVKYKDKEIKIIGEDKTLSIDEPLFSVAITNLIENALKYSQDVVVVDISSNQISVIDKGIGIDKDDIEKIKKRFYRVETNRWNNSLGLGLFIVQSIIKLHNFRLEIDSKLNSGSKFTIYH